MNVSDLNLV